MGSIDAFYKKFGLEGCKFSELVWNVVFDHPCIDFLICEDEELVVLDVQENLNIVFSATLQRKLCDHCAKLSTACSFHST
jgi:hypothetical protein